MALNHSVAINSAARRVTLLHPAAFSVVVSRKRVLRVEAGPDGDSVSAGMPTLGGMGVMRWRNWMPQSVGGKFCTTLSSFDLH
jgi:hypothetical protein